MKCIKIAIIVTIITVAFANIGLAQNDYSQCLQETREVRDSLAKASERLFAHPNDFDAVYLVEYNLNLARIYLDRCEGAEQVLKGAMEYAHLAQTAHSQWAKSFGRAVDITDDLFRMGFE